MVNEYLFRPAMSSIKRHSGSDSLGPHWDGSDRIVLVMLNLTRNPADFENRPNP
jgi:hypothetical protein